MPTRHYFIIPSPDYLHQGQLGSQLCNSVRGYTYDYPQHMIVLKHFVYIQYGCGEEVSSILQPEPCQHIITSSYHPQITQIWVNLLASNVTL